MLKIQSDHNDVEPGPERRSLLPDRRGANGSSIRVQMMKLSRTMFALVPLKKEVFLIKMDLKLL